MICEKCRRSLVGATCAGCGKHRTVFGRTVDERPLCKTCVVYPSLAHDCPDCARRVPGAGHAVCRTCGFQRTLCAKSVVLGSMFRHAAILELWNRFTDWSIASGRTSKALARLEHYAESLCKIDRSLGDGEHFGRDCVLRALTTEDFRRAGLLVSFLADRQLLDIDSRERAERSEQRRIDSMLNESSAQSWHALLSDYAMHIYSSERALTLRTQRVYLRAAAAFCAFAEAKPAGSFGNDVVDRFVRRAPGHRNSLAPFLRFLRQRGEAALHLPPTKRPSTSTTFALARDITDLLQAMAADDGKASRSARLAKILAILYGFPLEHILALRQRDLLFEESGVKVRLGNDWATVDTRIVQWLRWLVEGATAQNPNALLFPGRLRGDALSSAGVAYHVTTRSLAGKRAAYAVTKGPTISP